MFDINKAIISGEAMTKEGLYVGNIKLDSKAHIFVVTGVMNSRDERWTLGGNYLVSGDHPHNLVNIEEN